MGDLLAARVLADFYDRVTLVERDTLPADPDNRRGVPQGRLIHAIQARGTSILDELFPGFVARLSGLGLVCEVDVRSRANPADLRAHAVHTGVSNEPAPVGA